MNRTLLCLLMLAFSPTTFAQYMYVPMPLTDGEWRYRFTTDYQNNVTIEDYLLIGSSGDTTIGGLTYKKILKRSHVSTGTKPFSFPVQPVVADAADYPFYAMREDNKRVYMHHNGADTLIYDFNRVVGDTLPTVFNILPLTSLTQYYRIVQIDTVNIGGSLRKRFVAESITVMSNDTIRVIEGIGSDRGLFMNNVAGNYGFYVLTPEFHCMTAPGVYYSPDNGTCTNIWTAGIPTGVEATQKPRDLKVYPNPVDDVLNIEAESGGVITFYSIAGFKVLEHTMVPGRNAIRTTDLSGGLYVVIVKNENSEELLRQLLVKE